MTSHSVTLMAAKSPSSFTLTYTEQQADQKQKRFQNRVVLQPEIDLKSYTCRAVIDWADIRFRTVKYTQWKWIKHHIDKAIGERTWAEKGKLDDDGKYREFVVRIQEPVTRDLLLAEDVVRARWDLQEQAEIAGLEVSVDFKPREFSREALALMFGVLVRSHLPSRNVIDEPADRPRFAWGKGDDDNRHVLGYDQRHPERSDAFLLNPAKDEPAAFDATYYVGAKGSRSAWRTMVKVLDKQNIATGTRKVLLERERRVRLEVTVNESELRDMGIKTIMDLAAYRFQRLQGRYFKFAVPTFPQLATEPAEKRRPLLEFSWKRRLQRFLNAGVVGLEAWDEAWRRKKKQTRKEALGTNLPLGLTSVMTGSSSTLKDYNELTRKVIQALRHIDDRMRLKDAFPNAGTSDT
ncbi:hypothetical protein LB566_25070 [Mesorhizobium sp. CA13]|uniref:hypothetical protein n=1 Tax=Mesorhizobium sp. CA13 TaxID=2876643 RepID=UPI001CD00E19|nr:hypothetical protein [Mesorhizobium sp. CA13]MBZ9857068.1 hypothetical protein [Mesorhizobium sp. CA13]